MRRSGAAALGLSVASQLGWLGGCGDGSAAGPSEAAWRDLASSLHGTVLRPGEPGYSATGLPWNLVYSEIRPQGIALCRDPADVQTSVRWARDVGLRTVARSGGHSYAGYSATSGLLIDLSSLASANVNPDMGVIDLGAGTLLGTVGDALAPFEVVLPAGRCATVGISGLVLGGGFGFSARKFGLTSDNLLQTQIVAADGELLNCNETENPDLYWACRGGGGGNFGINVAFQLRVYPINTASVYKLTWNREQVQAAWAASQDAAFEASDDFSLRLGISTNEDGPLPGARNVSLEAIGQYFGPATELRDLLAPVLAAAPPDTMVIEELTIAQATSYLEEYATPDAFLTKSAYIPQPIPEQGIATLLDFIDSFPAEARAGDFTIFAWGGAINRVAPEETAFAHRSAAFVVESNASWHPGDYKSVVDASTGWIQDLFEAMQPYFGGGAYQNFIDPTLANWQSAYYAANFPRLVDVKAAYDPDNFFRFAQSIPTRIS